MKITITTSRKDDYTRKIFADLGVADDILEISESVSIELTIEGLNKKKKEQKVDQKVKSLLKD